MAEGPTKVRPRNDRRLSDLVRLTREAFQDYLENARNNLGSSEMYTVGGTIGQIPPGSGGSPPPDSKPAPRAPNGRAGINVLGAAVRAACNLYNPNPGGFIDTYLDFSEYTNSVSVADALMRSVCGAPPDGVLNPDAPQQPAAPTAPYSGGQCPGQTYRITYNVRFGSSPDFPVTDQRTSSKTWIGPIGSVIGPTQSGDTGAYSWDLTHDLDNPSGPRRELFASVGSPGFTPSISGLSPSTTDGSPDNCGDPPPAPKFDPNSPTPNPLPPFSFDPGDGGAPETYEPDISIEPGPTGPAIRFRFPDGDYYVDPGGIDVLPPGIPNPCCPPGDPGPSPDDFAPSPENPDPEPPPPGVPDENPESEEPQVTFVAAIVTLRNINTSATAIPGTDGGPVIYAPRLASLQFKIEAGEGNTGWTADIDIKNAQSYVVVPAPQGAVDVKVRPYGTASVSVQRIYAAVQAPLGEQK